MRHNQLLILTFLILALLLSFAIRPLIPFFPSLVPLLLLGAVAVAALVGSVRSTVTTIVVSAIAVYYFISPTHPRFSVSGLGLVRTSLFIMVATSVSLLVYKLREARAQELRSQNIFSESETKYRFLAESMSQYVWTTDEHGKVDYCNRHFLEFTGLTLEQIRAGRTLELIHPDDLAELSQKVEQSQASGQPFQHEYRARRASDGTYRWQFAHSESFTDARGRKRRLGVAIDITDRKMAELEVLKARSDDARFRLAAIVDSSDDAIISKDLQGIVTSWNTAAEHLFGYRAEEMIGRSILTIIPPELQNEEPIILARLRAGLKIDHYETERLHKNGSRVNVALTISPVRDVAGTITGASKIVRDISERKRVQEALIQSEKLAATGRMAAAIAHEVNNPLEAVTNLAYLVSTDESLSEVGRSYARMMIEEIARASEITKQTLAFYRDSGKPSRFDVRELVDDVIKVNRPALERRRIEVIRDYRRSEPLTGYASEIRQVMANLFLNAIDAVPDGGKIIARVDVEHPVSNHCSRIRVSVADTGHGVPLETRRRLFEPFVSTKGSRGNGLGLWVSKGIVQKHGGRIFMRSSSEPGRSGTVFSVVLPLQTNPVAAKTLS